MFDRYAIYYTAQGTFASAGAAWLGWDVDSGQRLAHPTVADLDVDVLTQTPRKYGFHGTLKAPFRLAAGTDAAGLTNAVGGLASQVSKVTLDGLEVAALGRFLALVPTGDTALLRELAAQVVRQLDPFRAPLSDADLARRRQAHLTPAQEDNLMRWGYPHVMDQFRFHMTLTGRLLRAEVKMVQSHVADHFAPVLPQPFSMDALTLVGQRPDGHFVTIERFPLI